MALLTFLLFLLLEELLGLLHQLLLLLPPLLLAVLIIRVMLHNTHGATRALSSPEDGGGTASVFTLRFFFSFFLSLLLCFFFSFFFSFFPFFSFFSFFSFLSSWGVSSCSRSEALLPELEDSLSLMMLGEAMDINNEQLFGIRSLLGGGEVRGRFRFLKGPEGRASWYLMLPIIKKYHSTPW